MNQMSCYRDYQFNARFNQQNEKSTSKYLLSASESWGMTDQHIHKIVQSFLYNWIMYVMN